MLTPAHMGCLLWDFSLLQGKLLNVREASHSQIMKNEEIQNICKILGLRHGEVCGCGFVSRTFLRSLACVTARCA